MAALYPRRPASYTTPRDTIFIDFALKRCRLTAVRYSKLLYGEAGITLERSGCSR